MEFVDAVERPGILERFYWNLVKTVPGWNTIDQKFIEDKILINVITDLRTLGYDANGDILDKANLLENEYDDAYSEMDNDAVSVVDSVLTKNPNLTTKEQQLKALKKRGLREIRYYQNPTFYNNLKETSEFFRVPNLKLNLRERIAEFVKGYHYNEITNKEIEDVVDTISKIIMSYFGFSSTGKDLLLKRDINRIKIDNEEKEKYKILRNLDELSQKDKLELLMKLLRIYIPKYSQRNMIPFDIDMLLQKKYNEISSIIKKDDEPSELFQNKDNKRKINTIEIKNKADIGKIKDISDRRIKLLAEIRKEVDDKFEDLTKSEENEIVDTIFARMVKGGIFNDLLI